MRHYCRGAACLLVALVWACGIRDAEAQVEPQTVADVSAIRAKTPEDRAVAAAFDHQGFNLLEHGTVDSFPHPMESPFPPSDLWADPVCSAQVVVIAHATERSVLLNTSGTGLVTLLQMKVDRALIPLKGPDSFRLALAGGRVKVGDKLISDSILSRFPPDFQSPRILFLKEISDARTFRVTGPQETVDGDWDAVEARVTRLFNRCGRK